MNEKNGIGEPKPKQSRCQGESVPELLCCWTASGEYSVNCWITRGWLSSAGYHLRVWLFYFFSEVNGVFSFWSSFYKSFARFSSQLVWVCCRSFLLFFCVPADFFFNRWYFVSLSSFLTYHGALAIVSVLSIVATLVYLCDSLLLPLIVVFRTSKLVLLSFCGFLVYFLCWV